MSFKSKLNFDNKTLFGLALILAGIFLHEYINVAGYDIELLMMVLPGFFLIFPNEKLKHSEPLAFACAIIGIIGIILRVLALISMISSYSYSYYSYYFSSLEFEFIMMAVVGIILAGYGLFCCYLLYVPSEDPYKDQTAPAAGNPVVNQALPPVNNAKFCKECGAKAEGNAPFCPECGKKL